MKTCLVDLVDFLSPFITLPLDPVTVEIGADAIQDATGKLVVLPVFGEEAQHIFV